MSLPLQADSLLSEPPGKPNHMSQFLKISLSLHVYTHIPLALCLWRTLTNTVIFPFYCSVVDLGFPGGSEIKNSPVIQEMPWVRSLGQEDHQKEGMATHSNILALENPMDRGAWQAAVHMVTQSWTQLK